MKRHHGKSPHGKSPHASLERSFVLSLAPWVLVSLSALFIPAPAHAQSSVGAVASADAAPIIALTGDHGTTDVPFATADQALAHARHHLEEMGLAISIARPDYPFDSLRAVAANDARRLLADLGGRGCSGIHLVPCAELYALAQEDDSAQAKFAARLATPGINVVDKAYTYGVAVNTFADYQRPARLPIAERYLAQLRALGPKASARQVEAEYAMTVAYYNLYQYDVAARHAMAAVELLPQVPYSYRRPLFDQENGRYGVLVDALSRSANGHAAVDALNAKLRAALPAPADSVALDQMFAYEAGQAKEHVDRLIAAHALIGTKGTAITSNYWINTKDTTEHAVPLADGKIRLLEFGSTGCGPCVLMYSALERIYEGFGDKVEPIIVTSTLGAWANRIISPADEVAKFKVWFQDDRKVRFPIALNKTDHVQNEWGDADASANPNYEHYIFLGKPTLYLVDGTGTIRRVFVGYSRETEEHITLAVRHLLGDTAPRATPAPGEKAASGTIPATHDGVAEAPSVATPSSRASSSRASSSSAVQ